MAGVYPNLDAQDLEDRVRTYLNEATASFYTQAEIYRWLSQASKDIAQSALCVRRVLDAVATISTRNVPTSCYKVMFVEYVPATGRPVMLRRITPLQLGHMKVDGTAPQYWHEFGSNIGIEPIPDAAYNLRLYVADIPKTQHGTYPIANFGTAWTATGSTWTNGTASASYGGTSGQSGTNRYETAIVAATNYTFTFNVTIASAGSFVIQAGTAQSPRISTLGIHAVTLTSGTGTNGTALTLAGTAGTSGTIALANLYILKEADYGTASDQTELSSMWQHLLALYATYCGLIKDKKYGPAKLLEDIYQSEIAYLKANVIEVIPSGYSEIKEQ